MFEDNMKLSVSKWKKPHKQVSELVVGVRCADVYDEYCFYCSESMETYTSTARPNLFRQDG